jgi:hypothetical protein
MLVSYATYKRGRPRVCRESEWYSYISVLGDPNGDTEFFRVHLVNKSRVTVTVKWSL